MFPSKSPLESPFDLMTTLQFYTETLMSAIIERIPWSLLTDTPLMSHLLLHPWFVCFGSAAAPPVSSKI